MSTLPRMMLTKLPVKDLARSRRFFRSLGFAFDPSVTTDSFSLIVVNDQAGVLLIAADQFTEHFGGFPARPLAEREITEAVLVVPARRREDVDRLAEAARVAGAYVSEGSDSGMLYGRSFEDPDGHIWESVWTSADARFTSDPGTVTSGA